MKEENLAFLNPTGVEQSSATRLLQNETLRDRCIFNLIKDDYGYGIQQRIGCS